MVNGDDDDGDDDDVDDDGAKMEPRGSKDGAKMEIECARWKQDG